MLTRDWKILWIEQTLIPLFKGSKNQTQKKLGRPRICGLIKEGRNVSKQKNKSPVDWGAKSNFFVLKTSTKQKRIVSQTLKIGAGKCRNASQYNDLAS